MQSNGKLISSLFFTIGLLMPIDFVTPFPPIFFDVLRYGIALVLILSVRTSLHPEKRPYFLGITGFLLCSIGILALLKAVTLGGSLVNATASLISPAIAYLLVRTQIHHRILLIGFVAGCTLSSIDIIFQAVGLPYLGNPSLDGFRFSGFSLSSTSVAPLLAVAVSLVITPWAWRKFNFIIRLGIFVALVSALFLSQGRGGLAGLIVALIIFFFISFLRKPGPVLSLTLAGSMILFASGTLSSITNFIFRTNAPVSGDFASGRGTLNRDAWGAFWQNGLLGVTPELRTDFNPHIALLSAGLNVGPLGLIATTLVCVFLFFLIINGKSNTPVVFRMIAGIALTTAFIEPNGFFIGFTGNVLVMICFAHFGKNSTNQSVLPKGYINRL